MKKIIKATVLILFIVLVLLTILVSCSIGEYNISSFEYQPKIKSQILSSDNQLIGEVYNENRTYVELNKIPTELQDAIIAVEDSRYYKHWGFDIIRMVKAIFVDIREGELKEGASTITQQLAKNLFLSNEKTFTRKFKELIYSIQLERKFTKDQILEMYLNEIYLGQMTYGVQEASNRFFGKNVWELSLAESAFIAGLPQAPSAYDPTKHFDRAKSRQETVINRMVANGDITLEQGEAAKKEEIIIIENKDHGFRGKYRDGTQHFTNQVIKELIKFFSNTLENKESLSSEEIKKMAEYKLENGGYKIYTTLNLAMQEHAVSALKNGIKKYGLGEKANGALVSIEPNTGRVLAYYGGLRDIDMANKPRQPGSTIKPLYFAAAINEGLIDRNTIILDEPTDFNGTRFDNYANKYLGYVTARETLVHSLNNASIKVMDYMGVNKAIDYFESFGVSTIEDEDYHLATAIGGMTYGISPLELTNAYSTIANEGLYQEAYIIERVEDQKGNVIYNKKNQQLEERQVLSPEASNQIEDILIDVVNRGTGTRARLPYYTSGKTGTTNDTRDLWFTGFVPSLATSVWLGNEENKQLKGGSGISAEIFKEYMGKIIENKLIDTNELEVVTQYDDTITISILLPNRDINKIQEITEEDVADIVIPSTEASYFQNRMVERVDIDSNTGKRFVEGHCPESNRRTKIYLQGQAPIEDCDSYHYFDRIQDFYDSLRNNRERYKPQKRIPWSNQRGGTETKAAKMLPKFV